MAGRHVWLGPWWAWVGAAAAGSGAWLSIQFGTAWLDEDSKYSISTHGIVLGVCAAATVWTGALISRRWRRDSLMLWAATAWMLAFPAWFQFAAVRLCFNLFHAVPIYDELGGGSMPQRMGTLAVLILLTGAATAGLLGGLSRNARLGWLIVIASAAAAFIQMIPAMVEPLVPGGVLSQDSALWAVEAPAPVWQFLTTWGVLRAAAFERRKVDTGRCGGCGYDLAGLGGSRCPECGAERTANRVDSGRS